MSDKWVDEVDSIKAELILKIHGLAREKGKQAYRGCLSVRIEDHPIYSSIDIKIEENVSRVVPWRNDQNWAYNYALDALSLQDLTELYELLLNHEKP